jgi:Na+-transporting NADH:ubiquinone oxidoreductase subunit NqrC
MANELKETIKVVGVSLLVTYFVISVLLSFAAITQNNKILDQQEQIQEQQKKIQRLEESLDFYIKASQKK